MAIEMFQLLENTRRKLTWEFCGPEEVHFSEECGGFLQGSEGMPNKIP
jgi:hypothetical protein